MFDFVIVPSLAIDDTHICARVAMEISSDKDVTGKRHLQGLSFPWELLRLVLLPLAGLVCFVGSVTE